LITFLLWASLGAAALVAAGAAYQAWGTAFDRRRFPPPGRMVRVGECAFHVYELGSGAPAVIFESGIAASSLNWRKVQGEVAGITRAVAYDRAGYGWSQGMGGARLASELAGELRAVLAAAGIAPPYVLCGHSFGGLIVRFFAARFPGEVGALVLVDPVNPAEWWPPSESKLRMLGRGVALSRRGALLARLGVVRFALALLMAGARRIPQAVSRMASGSGSSVTERIVGEVRKMPEAVWPMIRAHWCQPKSFLAMSGHLQALPGSAEAAEGLGDLGPEIAVTLIVAEENQAPDPTLRAVGLERIVASEAGHWVHLDKPEIVVEAIRGAVARVRGRGLSQSE
jgi:pimeloyl-ACP methyl ester carboxylesterase